MFPVLFDKYKNFVTNSIIIDPSNKIMPRLLPTWYGTLDETWIYYYTPEPNQQSNERGTAGNTTTLNIKAKRLMRDVVTSGSGAILVQFANILLVIFF